MGLLGCAPAGSPMQGQGGSDGGPSEPAVDAAVAEDELEDDEAPAADPDGGASETDEEPGGEPEEPLPAELDAGPEGDAGELSPDGGAPAPLTEVHELVVLGMDFAASPYALTVSGTLTGLELEADDDVDGLSAEGRVIVPGARDVYRFTGELTALSSPGSARVVLDGEILQGGPIVLEESGFDAETIRMTLHSSRELIRRNGRNGEAMVALHAARAFEHAGFNYEIVYHLLVEDPPDEVAVCGGGEAFSWWQGRVNGEAALTRRKDANLLLLDAAGGGCGAIRGWVGTSAGRHIDQLREWQPMGSDTWSRNVHGNLHEIGHQLGARHDHDPDAPGAQHRGEGWNEIDADTGVGYWHRTPTVAGSGAPGDCGDDIEQKQHSATMRHQLYSACASSQFFIRPD